MINFKAVGFFKIKNTEDSKFLKINKEKDGKNNKALGRCDKIFLLAVILLSVYGTLMVFSAGGAYAEFRYGDALYFVKKQSVWLIMGIGVLILTSRFNTDILKRLTPFMYAGTLVLLVLTLIIGFAGNGAQRWIAIGPLTLQPSEIGKLTLVLMLARYFSDYKEKAILSRKSGDPLLFGTLIPFIIMLVPILLVMLQHHLSCIIILGAIGVIIIFASGANPKYLYGFGGVGALGITYIAFFTDYTKDRITVWRDPEAYKLTGGWQTLQGLMAIGSGGLFGLGYGKSILKHCYVSEPANDMIFAILCEELGIVGAFAALALFALLILRGTVIALRCNDVFERLTVFGIMAKTAVQVLLNVAVVTNSIPNTGISLPFFSYGGSSLIMLFFEMGVVLSISRGAKIQK